MIKRTVRERPILFSGEMVRAILRGRKTQTRRAMKRNLPFQNEHGTWDWYPAGKALGFHARCGLPVFDVPQGWAHDWCPYGGHGEGLWVREAWRIASLPIDDCPAIQYRADDSIDWPDPLDPIFDWDSKYEDWFERMNSQLLEDCERAGLEVNINEEMAYTWDWDSIPTRWRPSIHMPRWASRITLEVTGVRVERVQDITPEDAEAEGIEPYAPIYAPSASAIDAFSELWDSLNAKYGWDVNPWVWVVEFRQKGEES